MKTSGTIAAAHSGNIGDVWASLPALKEYYRKTGIKVSLYLVNGHKAEYHQGATHPTRGDNGEMVMLNKKMIEMMIPLLEAQPYIAEAKIHDGEDIELDLDGIRGGGVGMPNTDINRWYFYIYPDLACDTSSKWLTVPEATKDFCKGKILINRTERYLNEKIDYEFLKPYEDECAFIGTPREWNTFCMGFDLNIKKVQVDNFLEYAQAVQQSKFYISNQSQGFQIAQGLTHPRILETCIWAANVNVHGEDAFDFLAQPALEFYFEYLYSGKKPVSDALIQRTKDFNSSIA